jgi:hypothetical protein
MTVEKNKSLNIIIKILILFVLIPFVLLYVLKDYSFIYLNYGKITVTGVSYKTSFGLASVFAAIISI